MIILRAVIQRVKIASVSVDGNVTGRIGHGILIYLGVDMGDDESDLDYIVKKTVNLRIFSDGEGKMNKSLIDVSGAVLLVSQFTLSGDARRGTRRPSPLRLSLTTPSFYMRLLNRAFVKWASSPAPACSARTWRSQASTTGRSPFYLTLKSFFKEKTMQKLSVLDTTLRDGCQGVKISYTVQDRLKIISLLDDFGVTYIELGNPTYSPKDAELFSKLKSLNLKNSRLACFGATRRIGKKAEEDSSLKSIAESVAPAAVIFGKAWDLHVTDILGTDLSENLSMIYDSVRFLADHGKEVIFDAEHFFDGYKNNPDYALAAVGAAYDAGASTVCLCDTNGGAFPDEIESAVAAVRKAFGREVGIHAHNDGAMAVSNSIFAVKGGATHVQGTMIGTGERCGNANLSAVIANLQLKRGSISCRIFRRSHIPAARSRIFRSQHARPSLCRQERVFPQSRDAHRRGDEKPLVV